MSDWQQSAFALRYEFRAQFQIVDPKSLAVITGIADYAPRRPKPRVRDASVVADRDGRRAKLIR